jgi:cobalt-zinc-cadmium efflux system protein
MSKGSLNVKAAFVHNVTDALGSVAVMVAGVLVVRYQLYVADAVATMLIAVYALYHGVVITREASRILTLGAPLDIHVPALAEELRSVEGVTDVHHVHVWELDESQRSFEGHIVVARRDVLTRHGISHATLECEYGTVTDGCCEGEVVAPH